MSTFTSSLPDNLWEQLNETAKRLNLPKNKLIEKALTVYLDQLKKAEYIKSYKSAAEDAEILAIAEEGMTEYFTDLENEAG